MLRTSVKSAKVTRPSMLRSTRTGRMFSSAAQPHTVTLFRGHGIGPEISDAVCEIIDRSGVPINWEPHEIGKPSANGKLIADEALDSVRRNGVALKGPLETPIGTGYPSLNLTLRKELGLYANVRPAKSVPGIKTVHPGVDTVVVRENTEGEYSGLEHEVVPGVVESLKVITREASTRVARYAFEYARKHNRNKVSAVHKANIMKKADGLFLTCCREVAAEYPDIKFEEVIVDACCMHLVKDPASFDVMVLPNLYGDIVSDLCAGLIGGLGLTPSGNYGKHAAMFEAVHGTAPDIAGKNIANPTALLLSSVMMLRHLGHMDAADRIERAVFDNFKEGRVLTKDLGGEATTTEFTKSIVDRL
eukprot:gb/GECH01011743.1/.p1 GENE.gb/GECH01011743.1/~~gb/GECH01011743.1/.p1  ORF type:complete len:361 (+),score=60.76 gb/GECH01011743.1/:1-1083(+)